MRQTYIVALREFRQRVQNRGFLLISIGLPLFFIFLWVVTGGIGAPTEQQTRDALEEFTQPNDVIGYVDEAGFIQRVPDFLPTDTFSAYETQAAADAALERGEIAAYYLVPVDYRETGAVQRISPQLPLATPDQRLFSWLLTANVLPDADQQELSRLREPTGPVGPAYVSLTPEGESEGAAGFSMMPFVVTLAILMPLFTSGGYLFQSLTEEKSSRVMEILLVSLRPRQLLTGKLLGLGALTLVQYLIWAGVGLAAAAVAGVDVLGALAGISLSLNELALIVPYALGGFTLYAALMAGVGALAKDTESSRMWVFVISVPMFIPIYLWSAIAGSPNGILATVLSIFPFSAPAAMLMRMTTTDVPTTQLLFSLALLVVTAAGVIWLMGRLFRAQTLLSGEALSVQRVWSALRTA